MVRRGFTLVEVVVALVVLGAGVLGVVGGALLAARALREAEAVEGAVELAGSVLDSLVQLPAVGAGERDVGRYRASWAPREGRGGAAVIELVVEYDGGAARRRLVFGVWHLPPLRRLGGG